MSMKKKFGMGAMSVALGAALIGGGTYAFFSDTETSQNTFAAGTLDLTLNPSTIVEVENLAPGDSMTRDFELGNGGSLDIDKVLLETSYTVNDANGDNTADLAEHIEVEFLYNLDKVNEVVYSTTLADLQNENPDVVGESVFGPIIEAGGLEAGNSDDLVVKFNFVDNGEDQNQFQGDSLELEWNFNATQKAGDQK
ncbi:spore coat-associated protein [Bacillus freudenreichii]|nr:spore coat-associated protein [Bacillus freudenreichii]